MNVYGELTGELSGVGTLSGTLSSAETLEGSLTIPAAILPPSYEGDYEFTPSEQTQVIDMSGQRAKQNIIINPIPSNYGRVTWNGTSLTIE